MEKRKKGKEGRKEGRKEQMNKGRKEGRKRKTNSEHQRNYLSHERHIIDK
jgi:hypothetical protein